MEDKIKTTNTCVFNFLFSGIGQAAWKKHAYENSSKQFKYNFFKTDTCIDKFGLEKQTENMT